MTLLSNIERCLQSDDNEIIDDQSYYVYPEDDFNSLDSSPYNLPRQVPNPYLTSIPYQIESYQQHKNNNSTLSKSILPNQFQNIFDFQYFNRMQSESFHDLFNESSNCIVSAPTGSGKTVLFELAIIKLLILKSKDSQKFRNVKVLYMAPTKALCSERHQDWLKKFSNLGVSVGLLTSDTNSLEVDSVKRSDIIICTPEKWDVLSRRWFDYEKLLELVQLLLVDEIHSLKEKRGTILEVVVTRMKRMNLNLRIIAVSATIPNIEDLSSWLKHTTNYKPATILKFNDDYRSVKLNKIVYGYKTGGSSTNAYQFDVFLNSKLIEVLKLHSKGKPVIIFCPTRNQCISTAKYLESKIREIYPYGNDYNQQTPILQTNNKDLQILYNNRISYHHAGLSIDERKQIEEGFKSGSLKILCSTSTLAVGVNLPAYCVIIKGTKAWANGSFDEYSEIDILQMLGRAGRPQFEKEGCVVIMTDNENKTKYERFVKGNEKLESSLHLHLAEHIASEILLGTIKDLETGLDWLRSTFFYQRFLKNPTAYQSISKEINGMSNNSDLQDRLLRFCEVVINKLIIENLVELEQGKYKCTPFGIAMCKHYVFIETVQLFMNLNKTTPNGGTLLDILKLLSRSDEFNEIRLKYHERKLFREINLDPLIKFQIENKRLEKNEDKISLIIQYELGGLTFPVYQGSMKLHQVFLSDKFYVFKQSPRILKAAIDIFNELKDSKSLLSTLKLYRCMSGKCWENSPMIFRQLNDIGLVSVRKFVNANIFTFNDLIKLPRDKIEYYLGLRPGGATKIVNSVKAIPLTFLNVQYNNHKVVNSKLDNVKNYVEVTISIELGLLNPSAANHIWNSSTCFVNIVTQVSSPAQLVDFRRLPVKKLKECSKKFQLSVKLYNLKDKIEVFLNFDELAGLNQSETWTLNSGLPKSIDVNSILAGLKQNKNLDFILNQNLDDSLSEFGSTDDELLDQILNSVKPSEPNQLPKQTSPEQVTMPPLLKEQNDEPSPDTTFTQKHSSKLQNGNYRCNHPCKDRFKCRHICCKEGIPKPKSLHTKYIKGNCLHSCADKVTCRHLCCRESIADKYGNRFTHPSIDNLTKATIQPDIHNENLSIPSQNLEFTEPSKISEIDKRADLNEEEKELFKTIEKAESLCLANIPPAQVERTLLEKPPSPKPNSVVPSTASETEKSEQIIAKPPDNQLEDLKSKPSNPFKKRPRNQRTKRQKLLLDLNNDSDYDDNEVWGTDDFTSTLNKITTGTIVIPSVSKNEVKSKENSQSKVEEKVIVDLKRKKEADTVAKPLFCETSNETIAEMNTTIVTMSTDVTSRSAHIIDSNQAKEVDIIEDSNDVDESNKDDCQDANYDELALLLGSDIEII